MSRKVYVLLFTLSIGGAERHGSSIANYLAEKGYDVSIVLLEHNKVEYELYPGVKVVALCDMSFPDEIMKPSFAEKVKLKLYRAFSAKKYEYTDRLIYIAKMFSNKLGYYLRSQPDIAESTVVSFMTIPNICAVMNKNLGYKAILAEFNSPHLEYAPDAPENSYKRKYYPSADGFVFQTDEQKSFYTFCPDVKMTVIPNPVEKIAVEPFSGERRKEIVNYCRHVKFKNLPLLIEAFSKLSPEYPDYKLVIYGDGPEKPNTEKCIEKYGLEDKVELKPFFSNVLELVRDSAMFVSSSDREGISNSMLEAMAIGLPTVCTDCPAGGPKMFIRPYENGLTVPVGDADALYKAMKYMIDHPDEAQKMGERAVEIRDVLEKNKILNKWYEFVSEISEG